MYFIIPLSIIGLSALAILIIVWRKVPYLKKLTPDAHEMGETFWHDMFPEVVQEFRKVPLNDARNIWLKETEKLLRKIRLMFSKFDRVSSTMIHRMRKEELKAEIENPVQEQKNQKPTIGDIYSQPKSEREVAEALRLEEQHLIVEIAKDPKNANLYVQLGEVYMNMNDFTDARDSFKAAHDLDPEDQSINKKLSAVAKKLSTPQA
ncbi:MAG: tetratricopeptide repeat protein [Candidatus Yanofskybacteria bacterium]|nr:tetratricopeptide repeat protein [Candidatus Yanofskybacteria bacterium]